MNITRENIDELNATLTITIEKADYESKVDEILKEHRKKATMPGFRPGKVPFGMIKKMYGTSVMVDEINKMISESLNKYITDEKLNVLGEPMPNETDQEMIDWENQESFDFKFDIGIAPEFELKLSKRDKIPYYDIQVSDDMLDSYVKSYTRRFGTLQPANVVEENETLRGNFVQCDVDGNIMEDGITADDAVISLEVMKNDDIKSQFNGAKVDDIITFNVKEAYPNETEISSLLKIDKEKVAEIIGDFQFTVKEISKFTDAEINQELFDKAFGEGAVKSEEEFRQHLSDDIKKSLARESDYKFQLDTKDKLVNKAKIDLPSAFLKRWLIYVNKDKFSEEDVEKDFPRFEEDLKWQLIKDSLIKEHELKVEQEEVIEYAKEFTRAQFAQYGLNNLGDEHVEQYAMEMLKKQDEARNIYERKFEEKVIEKVKELVKIDEKEVSSDEFNKLFEKK